MNNKSTTLRAVHVAGTTEREIPISVGSRFLELFSKNLYSSPNKAFEELVSNSWDADATAIYISLPENLKDSDATVWVLDNGVSMDSDGMELLWRITSDHKRTSRTSSRPPIGKFGIGKLSTYILAAEITFICRADDGLIRTVALDYRDIEQLDGVWKPEEVPLSIKIIGEGELQQILSTVPSGTQILELIEKGVPYQQPEHQIDEFHHPVPPAIRPSKTWTLVLLTSLHQTGRSIQRGQLRRMLRSALPLSSNVSIVLNEEPLKPTKIDEVIRATWTLGKDLDIDKLVVSDLDTGSSDTIVGISSHNNPGYPHLEIEGIEGRISGQVTLFQSRISGGKSTALGASNGFFVNILGRVINLDHTDFGLKNLSHGAWAQFRATVRADGLDSEIGVEREGLRDSRSVKVFMSFLMATFNKARKELIAAQSAEWLNAGDMLDGSWNFIPLKPLAEVVAERLNFGLGLPDSIENPSDEDLGKV